LIRRSEGGPIEPDKAMPLDIKYDRVLQLADEDEEKLLRLEWLEQGRSIVWNQLLSLRTPVDALRDVDRALADALLHTSIVLERASYGNSDMQDISLMLTGNSANAEFATGQHASMVHADRRDLSANLPRGKVVN
jgi:hypothetical protein